MIDSKDIDRNIYDIQIPPRPDLLVKLDNLLKQQPVDIDRLANLVSRDVAVTAAVLKIVNSPLFNLKREIINVRQATLYVGVNGLVTLVRAFSLRQVFLQDNCCLSLGRFWDTADEIARVAININKIYQLELSNDHLYALGLFHDIGLPIFASMYSDYKETLMEANRSAVKVVTDLEVSRYGTDHAKIGQLMAQKWHLPQCICNVIGQHHQHGARTLTAKELRYYAVFQLAEAIVHQTNRGKESLDWCQSKDEILAVLGLTLDDIHALTERALTEEIQ